jgi:Domain of unknown function (DUF4177)
MTGWEYKYSSISLRSNDRDVEQRLNDWGREGWELASTIGFGPHDLFVVILKRPVADG